MRFIRPDPKVPHRRGQNRAARKKFRPEAYCCFRGCYKPVQHIGMCRAHANAHLHGLVRLLVVPNEFTTCEAAAWHAFMWPCAGPIQVNHIIDREYLLVAWDLDNVLPGCSKLNKWAHFKKQAWARMVKDWRGQAAYRMLEDRAFSGAKPDYDAIHDDLHQRLGQECERRAA